MLAGFKTASWRRPFAATASAGNENGVIASASGGYGFSTSSLDVGPFTWNAQVYADGSVDGSYNYTQVSTSTGAALTVSGPLTCAVIIGNHVWVGGIIEESSRDSLIGLNMWFQARGIRGQPPAKRARSPARDEHHDRHCLSLGKQLCDVKAVQVRQLDVEQHDVRTKHGRRFERRGAVTGLADDREAPGLKQRCGRSPKGGVIVDDQHRLPHARTLARSRAGDVRATTEFGSDGDRLGG